MEEYLQIIRINQLGTFLGMRTCFAQMRDAGGGSIVNIASTAGIEGVPLALAYTASKHAVVGMTKAAALEFGPAKVRVNVVCPGAMLTPLLVESLNVPLECPERGAVRQLADGAHGQTRPRSPRRWCSWPAMPPPTPPAASSWSTAGSRPASRCRRSKRPRRPEEP